MKILASLIGTALAVSVVAPAQAGTLNLAYQSAYIDNGACEPSLLHGVQASDIEADAVCGLTIPLPVEAHKKITQITIFFGAEPPPQGEGAGLVATVFGRTLPLNPEDFSKAVIEPIAGWAATTNSTVGDELGAPISAFGLIGMSTSVPGYENGFVVDDATAYSISIDLTGVAEFYGIRVDYDDAPQPASTRSPRIAQPHR